MAGHPDSSARQTDDGSGPPRAELRPQLRRHHDDEFHDPYEWLRDKDDPEVLAYLNAENAWTEQQTRHLRDLSEAVFTEIKARTQETDLSVPTYRSHADGSSAYWYYVRTFTGQEYPLYCRAPAGAPQPPPELAGSLEGEQVLLNGNELAAGHDFFSFGSWSVSVGGDLLAYATDTRGDERYTIAVKDLTDRVVRDQVENAATALAWAGDTHLFYVRFDDAWRPYQVWRHEVGRPAAEDALVFEEPDRSFAVGVSTSRDRRWVLIGSSSITTSECRMLSADDPTGEFRLVAPRRTGVLYEVEVAGDRLLVLHNDQALDFELAEAPLTATSHTDWTTVIAHEPGVRLLGVAAYEDHVVVSLRRDALSGVHVLPRSGQQWGPGSDLRFDEPIYTVDAVPGPEYRTPTIRIEYESMLTPSSVYDYDLRTGDLTLLKVLPVLDDPVHGPYRPTDYVQERAWAPAEDGTHVPISIVRRADVARDGQAPLVLYGYGAYEIAIDPTFSIRRLSLLDRGVIFAIAHVRGGGELGRRWYEQGKLLHKKNTFTDFVAAARWLVAAGYTNAQRLGARGGSAGGLLMGAVTNAAPELFRAVHADVPFVDPLTTILDPDLPLTVIEWDEWGDPLHDPDVYAYMKSYSPYENVRSLPYPAILATTSLNDTRVYYVEPAKWVAALRFQVTDSTDRSILLKTEMAAGHQGVSGRYAAWRQEAFETAWMLDQICRDAPAAHDPVAVEDPAP